MAAKRPEPKHWQISKIQQNFDRRRYFVDLPWIQMNLPPIKGHTCGLCWVINEARLFRKPEQQSVNCYCIVIAIDQRNRQHKTVVLQRSIFVARIVNQHFNLWGAQKNIYVYNVAYLCALSNLPSHLASCKDICAPKMLYKLGSVPPHFCWNVIHKKSAELEVLF